MEAEAKICYYLGANAPTGFYSLYDQMLDPEKARDIRILKGGPGCGKSSLMRRVAQAMEEMAEITAGCDATVLNTGTPEGPHRWDLCRLCGQLAAADHQPVVLDPVGANYVESNLQLLAQDGRWVLIGLMGGRKAELDLALVLGKRIQLLGSTLRSRDDQFKADLLSDLGQQVWPLFTEKRLSPQLAKTFPIEQAQAAFDELAGNQVSGKLVLVIDPDLL